jgi:hypothetical protein
MLAPARVRAVAVVVSLASATATATAQTGPEDDAGLPLTPPPLQSSNPDYEATPAAPPCGSAGFALLVAIVGPVGLALGGVTAASASGNVAVPFTPTPRARPLAPAVERPAGPSE